MFFKENGQYRCAVYLRLSRSDGDQQESNSIKNQRALLNDYLGKHPELHKVDEYVDDGYSGTNFERPDFKRMMQDIQMVCNVLCAHPVELQLEDFLHDARRVFIYNQMVLVFRVFLIPVSCKAANELTFFPFYIQVTSDTHGNVTAIGIVDKIVERNQDTSLIIVFFRTVIMIVDGDEADSHKWKDSFQITSGFNVVSAES